MGAIQEAYLDTVLQLTPVPWCTKVAFIKEIIY